MTVGELIERLNRLERAGRITDDDEVVLRNPEVSEDAMEAGSDGYLEADEILAPGDGRVILLGVE